ncbi:DNA-directed RNA polymerases IV and V subunit 4-like [Lotus japonicus]|uniref:DNA-directed RNA polymerases IV and V subunit 4-like n=1 Tax=Lotus japonicus TaxID=34305 RepID=UPI002590E8DD|nr:DNA-directed RNA polymerases IV and V subunit 4-like [Lotus japonicus]
MSDKTGKGFTPFGKAGSLKGKDDSTPKSAQGRKAQFSKEGPFQSRMNGSPTPGGKGEKEDKAANGGKTSGSQDLKIDRELPANVKCLMDCEAADILQGIQEQMVTLSRDPTIKLPGPFDKGLQYAKSSSKYTNAKSIRRIVEPLANNGLTDCEVCVIANVCPETVDEIYALLPSLKGKINLNRQLLEDSVSELAKLRRPV